MASCVAALRTAYINDYIRMASTTYRGVVFSHENYQVDDITGDHDCEDPPEECEENVDEEEQQKAGSDAAGAGGTENVTIFLFLLAISEMGWT